MCISLAHISCTSCTSYHHLHTHFDSSHRKHTRTHTNTNSCFTHCSLYILVTVFPGTRSILFWEDHPFGSVFSAQLTSSSTITGLRGGPSVFGVRVCGSCMCVRVCWSCVCTHVCVYVVENYPLYVFLKIVCACVGLYIL